MIRFGLIGATALSLALAAPATAGDAQRGGAKPPKGQARGVVTYNPMWSLTCPSRTP
jgi:hypothetical protein